MRFNIFEGTRRIVLFISVVSVLGFGFWAVTNSDATVYTTFTVDSPGAIPTWTSWESTYGRVGRTEFKNLKTKTGTSVSLYLYFPEKPSADGRMLIPFRSEGGTWWMNSSHSESVITYTKQVADPPPRYSLGHPIGDNPLRGANEEEGRNPAGRGSGRRP